MLNSYNKHFRTYDFIEGVSFISTNINLNFHLHSNLSSNINKLNQDRIT